MILVSTKTHVSLMKSIQSDMISVLQKTHPWVQDKDILDNPEHENTLLMKKIKTLNITQKAQREKTVEELFLDWDGFPSLTEDTERVEGTIVDNSEAWGLAPSHLHTKGVSRLSTTQQVKHNRNYHHPNKKVKVEVSHNFSHSNGSNSEDSYSTYQS